MRKLRAVSYPASADPQNSRPDSRSETGSRGERRIVTALFCDVASSTTLAGELDPEEWVEQIDDAFSYLTDAVDRYGGNVIRLLGDSVLAFFGAPVAHEDDPERAVLAGLAMLEDLKPFQARFQSQYGLTFDIRVGINTGEVIFGTLAASGDEYTALGDAVNIAARMQQLASPNSVQISAETYAMVASLFEVESLGGIEVKGKSEPMNAYRVIRYQPPSRALGGVDVNAAPLVGRQQEMAQIRETVDNLRNGQGWALMLIGETGLGKTRLIDELHRYVSQGMKGDEHWSETRGVSYESLLPYSVFSKLLRQDLRIDEGAASSSLQASIERRYADIVGDSTPSLEHAIQSLMSVSPGGDGAENVGESFQRELYDAVTRFYRSIADRTGLILALDDLHWLDSASTELLKHMTTLVQESRTLIVCALRPEQKSAAWSVRDLFENELSDRCTLLELLPLDQTESVQLVSSLQEVTDRSDDLGVKVHLKTGGNPLFIEEVVRAFTVRYPAAPGGRSVSVEVTISDSLQALLTARIDFLGPEERHLLQIASVIGRTFSQQVLERVVESGDSVDERLLGLARTGLLEETQRIPERHYGFRHELLRDVVYHSILRRDRRKIHGHVAESIEELGSGSSEENAFELAHHYREGGDHQRALHFTTRSADRARDLYALEEAVTHYSDAIAISLDLDGRESERAKLHVERARLLVIQGEFERAQEDYEVALEMARLVADRTTEWNALEGLGVLWYGRNYDRSEVYLEEALTLAREIGEKLILGRSLLQYGTLRANMYQSDARGYLEQARDLFIEIDDRRWLAEAYNLISQMVDMSSDAIAFVRNVRRAAELYREVGYREGVTYALTVMNIARAEVFNRTLVASDELSVDEAIATSDEVFAMNRDLGGWPMGESWGRCVYAMILHGVGRSEEGLDHLARGREISERVHLNEVLGVSHLWEGLIYRDLLIEDLARERWS